MTTKIMCLGLMSLLPAQAADTFQRTVGVYHWGGEYPASVGEGVRQIAALGSRIARITLSARSFQDYHMAPGCYPNFSLASFAREPDIKTALDNPAIDVYVLTVYDGISFADCLHQNFLVPAFYTQETQSRIVEEYADFTLYLYQTYASTHKRFILSNWEGDNAVYCGQANSYALDQAFRAYCDAMYPQWYGGNRTPDESFSGLKRWFELRQQGVAKGRERAAALGTGGMRVYIAIEFCAVRVLRDRGFKSVLYDVAPFVIFDYVSYSAYESISGANPGASLIADLNTIRDVVGSTEIIIGESGFARSQWSDVVSRTHEVIDVALSWGVPYLIQWELYDQSASSQYGLFDKDGNSTALGADFQRYFVPSADQPQTATISRGSKQ